MSTVALKGTLEYNEGNEEWTWKGSWAFGSSLDEALRPAPSRAATPSRFLPPPPSQPFLYTWKEAAEPSRIPVPSLNVVILGGDDDDDDDGDHDDRNDQEHPKTTDATTTPTKDEAKPSASGSPATETPATTTERTVVVVDDVGTKTTKEGISQSTTTNRNSCATGEQAAGESKSEPTKSSETEETPVDKEQKTDSVDVKETSVSSDKEEMKTDDNGEQNDVIVKDSNTPTNKEGPNKMTAKASDKTGNTGATVVEKESPPQKVDKDKTDGDKKDSSTDATSHQDMKKDEKEETISNDADRPPLDSNKEASSTPTRSETATPLITQSTVSKPKPPPVTFASVMEGFTDAAAKHKDRKCPPSGKWEGHFENVTGRNREKFQKVETQKVQETFHLFLNATPGEDAAFTFEDASADHIPTIPESSSDPKLVQVRGCGENQFGTFEICGYLDLSAMILEIQRQYVITERRATPRRRSNSSARSSRPYSTRKRQPSWKRKSYDPDEDTYGRKKRAKTSHTPQPKPDADGVVSGEMVVDTSAAGVVADLQSTLNVVLPNPVTTTDHSTGAAPMLQGDVKAVTGLPPSSLRITVPTQASSTSTKARRSSGGGGTRSKRGPSKSGSVASSFSSSTASGSSPYIRLPAAGDPKKARWRAAHFLYYQRHEPETQQQSSDASSSKPNSPKVAQKPKYVIYEGELVDNKREGRGICLYSNGTMYEGNWKRNKEHGYGKLMTSDRRKTIYEGEWERGKIQGSGTYYYGSSDPVKPGPRYVGEFKENLRNGMGIYYLPDGSIYDGQWRDGVMNGRGMFSWPDNSLYDGEWKEGKRNGQGLLKASDGFVYDGQWVNNAMEGRGLAIYPNGQRYEGMFSNGRREGRGTIHFTNGAIYEGRFREDAIDGQGTMKMTRVTVVPRAKKVKGSNDSDGAAKGDAAEDRNQFDFMIPISFQSDLTTIHNKAGFTAHGE